MSAIWQTIIGGLLATLGGLLAVWWQARRADDVARRIRAEERREAGLLALNVEVTAMHESFDALYRAAEKGQATSQYLNAITTLARLRQLWEGSSSGVIADKAIVDAYTALDVAAREELPVGGAGAQRQRELSTGDADVGLRFVRDLGHVLGLLGEFKKEVQQETVALARR